MFGFFFYRSNPRKNIATNHDTKQTIENQFLRNPAELHFYENCVQRDKILQIASVLHRNFIVQITVVVAQFGT